jgi:hypothetical protein
MRRLHRSILQTGRILGAMALVSGLLPSETSAAPMLAPAPRRIAVVVGANEAPADRTTLRYAYDDARAMAGTLVDVAGFAPDDVHVLLDPEPSALLSRLDAALATLDGREEALLFFYYSGHSDTQALYPGGRALRLDELKRRLEDPRASVRVGVLDACSGGAWTGAKGLQSAEPFVVEVPFTLGAEGSVLLAASSGAENAHEYERLGGSFFTHHLVAGLRGGAERNGDGVVSLDEAFEYAKAGTLRDSAIFAAAPQHPSFVKNLRGRSDLPLARVSAAPTRVVLEQDRGPLQVIRLDRGLVVLETPPGPRRVSLALQPGDYLVRRREGNQSYAAEVELTEGRMLALAESSLSLRDVTVLRAKAPDEVPVVQRLSLPGGTWEAQIVVGNQFDQQIAVPGDGFWFAPGLAVGVTDRLQLALLPSPKVAYQFGDPGALEALVSVGTEMPFISPGLRSLFPTASGLLKTTLKSGVSLLAGVSMTSSLWFGRPLGTAQEIGDFKEWLLSVDGGCVFHPFDRVWITPSIRYQTDDGELLRDADFALTVGSAFDFQRGARPLVQIELGDGFFLDGHASLAVAGPPPLERRGRYGAGVSWVF